MSILNSHYELSVWQDILVGEVLQEKKICVIGSDTMFSQSGAFEPNFVRNVNGQKKLSFKMYKHYIDNITGEKVDNPFTDLLKNETKVKLYYEDKWYDFIVKNISENSANYLCTYQLEDALVQELSKNGFGITLDAQLNNNMGNAKELAEQVLAETDWEVESEVFVQTVDENLVYVTMPPKEKISSLKIIHAKDQIEPYTSGVTEEELTETTTPKRSELAGKTILAFYSSCKNKPHRFQFIYSPNGYGKNADDTYKISRKDDRIINQANCQYYIDFNYLTDYVEPSDEINGNGAKSLGLYLPEGFSVALSPAYKDGDPNDVDSVLSSWYRGKRYGFAQQAVYVPALDKYCQKFTRNEVVDTANKWKILPDGSKGTLQVGEITQDETKKVQVYNGIKQSTPWSGLYLDYDYTLQDIYVIDYKLQVHSGKLQTIGGHNAAFDTKFTVSWQQMQETATITNDVYTFSTPIEQDEIIVHAEYSNYNATANSPWIFIQPNRGVSEDEGLGFDIIDLTVTIRGDYLGYTTSEFISPTFVQNYITNYNFESKSGWTATSIKQENSSTKPTVENVYGRFSNNNFISLVVDYQSGSYDPTNEYSTYMKMSFLDKTQFVLNSGIKDNRTLIENMAEGEEWVIDYQIVDAQGYSVKNFDFELGEYLYDIVTGGYKPRAGFISFGESRDPNTNESPSSDSEYSRKIIKVDNNKYNKEDFKKHSKVYLKIKPPFSENDIDPNSPPTWYIQKIAIYRKVLNNSNEIIIPDYEETNSKSAKTFAESGVLEKRYHYFNEWQVNPDNEDMISEAGQLLPIIKNELNYIDFIPVYNEGAEKIRAVTVKESNYFNILQSIAETFEAWLSLEITRDEFGGILSKKVQFKNYVGNTNHANFRYGVNLKDISRTRDSKNITTKLIVKANSNELAEGGLCTIQKAGANPTGENYIYDFQYYQNQGIMNVNDYLDTVYYIDGAAGEDADLWEGAVAKASSENTTLNGYYSRLKKLNDTVIPISDEIIGLQSELIQKKAQKEATDAIVEASTSGVEQTREDFHALTGVYPEDAQNTSITDIRAPQDEKCWGDEIPELIVPEEEWWHLDQDFDIDNKNVLVRGTIAINDSWQECSLVSTPIYNNTYTNITTKNNGYDFKKISDSKSRYDGICIEAEYEQDRRYKLTYTITTPNSTTGLLKNIGCHNSFFTKGFYIHVKDSSGKEWRANDTTCELEGLQSNAKLEVTVSGYYIIPDASTDDFKQSPCLWIQPNREIANSQNIQCSISDVKLYKYLTPKENTKNYDRSVDFLLNVEVKVDNNPNYIPRSYEMNITVPANASSVDFEQTISSVDLERSDVMKYMTQYVTYKEQLKTASDDLTRLTPEVTELEQAIKLKEAERKQYLEYKRRLNELFFKKYSRFITEGTWINEEYIDNDKYYADAQSVLYNSCYPQVVYGINVLFLSKLPGYELFKFNLGDTTYVIDDEFFGKDKKQEVIITEISEVLDDPNKDTIKVQTFKTQFQDLFQKITATVQQTQYNVGSYEKGAAFVDANLDKQAKFLTDILNSADTYLQAGASIVEDNQGILITNLSDKKRQLRLTGGAILLSAEHPKTKEQVWRTGLTNEGISADLITAGQLDAGVVQIMSGKEPVFRWDAYGISAYDATWTKANGARTISGVNSKKFVRFDKNGIYGINNVSDIDGATWHPDDIQTINKNATFALTWEGLKVQNKSGTTLMIGDSAKVKEDGRELFVVSNVLGETMFAIDEQGSFMWGSNSPYNSLSQALELEVEKGKVPFETMAQWDRNCSAGKKVTVQYVTAESFNKIKKGYLVYLDGRVGETFDSVTTPKEGDEFGTARLYFTVTDKYSTSEKGYCVSGTSVSLSYIWDEDKAPNYVLGSLTEEANDGIYKYQIGGKACIGINATAINTGAINVGGTAAKMYADAQFYASVDPNKPVVYIAGWQVEKGGFSSEGERVGIRSDSEWVVDNSSIRFYAGSKPGKDASGKLTNIPPFYILDNGFIKASRGQIGGWSMDYLKSSYTQDNEIGLFKKGEKYCSGMAAKGDGSSVAFWAGCPGGTPWENDNYADETNFYVTEKGELFAQSGKIGGWEVTKVDWSLGASYQKIPCLFSGKQLVGSGGPGGGGPRTYVYAAVWLTPLGIITTSASYTVQAGQSAPSPDSVPDEYWSPEKQHFWHELYSQ